MPLYRYTAAQHDGSTVRGVVEAGSSDQAGTALVERGLHPLRLELGGPESSFHRSAGRRDLSVVFRSLASLVSAGMPLNRAVAATVPMAHGRLRELLVAAGEHLRAGRTLTQALAGEPGGPGRGLVPPVALGMLRAGERAGQLKTALEEIADQLEREAELVAKVRQALAYPLLLAGAGTASVVVIGTVVVPKFAALLADLGQTLPPATRLLLASSAFLLRHGVLLLAAGLGAIWLFVVWVRRPTGRLQWHAALLTLPGVGAIRLTLASARTGRALGGALHAGMPLLPALAVAREAVGDQAVAQRLADAGERVSQGQPLAVALEQTRAVSATALQLIAVGEASGALATMAGRAGELAAQEAERGLKTLVSLMEPALVVFFGGLVAFVAAALLQAVYSLRPGGL